MADSLPPRPGTGADRPGRRRRVRHWTASYAGPSCAWDRPREQRWRTDPSRRPPDALRRRTQPLLKASAADAHPLVGACNDPRSLRDALLAAGFEDVRLELVPNLARSWQRRWWTFALGLAGDLLTRSMPSRRSTILATATRPGR